MMKSEYFAISHNTVHSLGEHECIQEAISATSKFFKNSIFPAVTVSKIELSDIQQMIEKALS